MSTTIDKSFYPAVPDAERAVLAGILGDNEFMAEAIASLRPEHFATKRERIIFAYCRTLWESNETIDEMTLAHAMTGPGELQEAGGVAYLAELADSPKRSSITSPIELILACAKRRNIISVCGRAASIARDSSESIDGCVGDLRDRLLEMEASYETPSIQHVRQFTDRALLELDAESKRERDLPGLTFTIKSLDRATTGIREGQFVILGGRIGEGKSALATQIALKNAIDGVPIGIFSLELRRQEILHRLWAQYGAFQFYKIAFHKIRTPRTIKSEEWKTLARIATDVGNLPIYIDDTSSLSIRQIAARAELMVKRFGVGLIVVDYLQIIDAPGRDERERLTKISNALRALAKQGVPVLALSQLSRPKDPNSRPTKYSLKESGSLEADAHLVLLIYRPTDDESRDAESDEEQKNGSRQSRKDADECDEILVAKQRSGPVGSQPVKFDEDLLVFRGADDRD